MGNSLPSFVDEIPDYSVTDGRIRITMGEISLVMPIHIFLAGSQLGKNAIADWQRERRTATKRVIPFKARV